MKHKLNDCIECKGFGYFTDVESVGLNDENDPYNKPHIEKCDECQVFYSDLEVAGFHFLNFNKKELKFIK
jgi:hypothetical protein